MKVLLPEPDAWLGAVITPGKVQAVPFVTSLSKNFKVCF